jgi:osmoprotectant transport system ATP-binding protein
MDEPLGALDPLTRADLQGELADIIERSGKTVLFVTHDIAEALKLGDRIALLGDGQVIQVGTPQEVLVKPVTKLVEEFFGNERFVRLLSLISVNECKSILEEVDQNLHFPKIPSSCNVLEALETMMKEVATGLWVHSPGSNEVIGLFTFDHLLHRLAEFMGAAKK